MNILVHVHYGVSKYGYEIGTRQAWKCGENAHKVTRVIGVIKGKIVCVIDGVHAERSTPENNPAHNSDCEGKYIFLAGTCWHEKDIFATNMPAIMFKKVKGLNQGHRYLTDQELEERLA